MRYIVFELSMPNVGSWNGKWTGEKNIHCIVSSYRSNKENNKKIEELVKLQYCFYAFGDGWTAGVSIKEVDAKTAKYLKKHSAGFCGYDWMVEEMKTLGRIVPREERYKIAETSFVCSTCNQTVIPKRVALLKREILCPNCGNWNKYI